MKTTMRIFEIYKMTAWASRHSSPTTIRMSQLEAASHVAASMEHGVSWVEFPTADTKAGGAAKSTGCGGKSTRRIRHTTRRPTIFARSVTDKPVFPPPKSPKRRDFADPKRKAKDKKRE